MSTFVTVIHIVSCVLLVLVVMLQSGKGAEISASFSGSSQTIFGSSGGANFFTRFTSGLAAVFFTTSVVLTLLGGQAHRSVFEGQVPAGSVPAPTAPAQQTQGNQGEPKAPAAGDPASGAAPAVPAEKK